MVLPGAGGGPHLLEFPGGPPLCVIDDYPYKSTQVQFSSGDTLVLSTDGIQEAQNEQGELYGRQRFSTCLERCLPSLSVDDMLMAVTQDVADFVEGAEAVDDATLLILRWRGPASLSDETGKFATQGDEKEA